eukprot:TRINITY_DN12143_c4_g2_i6.p1 TRINITY_DN12143_c4_g2~~TRINITY_DN12143_c4_g2_i6.p1  ORF type:complete len:1062 (+),score=217.92 TRINITY_DN12143_c4_g2_i6:298-3186(+)
MSRPKVSVTVVEAATHAELETLDSKLYDTAVMTPPARLEHATIVQPQWKRPLPLPFQWPEPPSKTSQAESDDDDDDDDHGHANNGKNDHTNDAVLLFTIFDEVEDGKQRRRGFGSTRVATKRVHIHAFAFLRLTFKPTVAGLVPAASYLDKDLRLQCFLPRKRKSQPDRERPHVLDWFDNKADWHKLAFGLHVRLSLKQLLAVDATANASPRSSTASQKPDDHQQPWTRYPDTPFRLPNAIAACLQTGTNRITAGSFAQDGSRLAVAMTQSHQEGVDDYSILIYSIHALTSAQPSEVVGTLSCHQGNVYSLVWSTNGQRLASASADGMVVVWNVKQSNPVAMLAHPCFVYAAAFITLPSNQEAILVLSAGYDGLLRLWRPDTTYKANGRQAPAQVAGPASASQLLMEVLAHDSHISTLVADYSSMKVYTGGGDGVVKVWFIAGTTTSDVAITALHSMPLDPLSSQPPSIKAINTLPGQRLIAATSAGLFMINLTTLTVDRSVRFTELDIVGSNCLSLTADGEYMLLASQRQGLQCYKTKNLAAHALTSKSWPGRGNAAGVICHSHEHLVALLHGDALGVTLLKHTREKPMQPPAREPSDTSSLDSLALHKRDPLHAAKQRQQQPQQRSRDPGRDMQRLLDLRKSYADDLLRSATQNILRQSAQVSESVDASMHLSNSLGDTTMSTDLNATADQVAQALKTQLRLPAPLRASASASKRLSVSFDPASTRVADGSSAIADGSSAIADGSSAIADGSSAIADGSSAIAGGSRNEQVDNRVAKAEPERHANNVSTALVDPRDATSMATPLNMNARRRRRRKADSLRHSMALDAQLISDPTDDRDQPSTLDPDMHFAGDMHAHPQVIVSRPSTPTNQASRRRRRAGRELSASRVAGNRRDETVQALTRDPTRLLLDDDENESSTKDTLALPGQTQASTTINPATDARLRRRERRSRAAGRRSYAIAT